MNKRTCTMPDCVNPHRARGLCSSHYNAAHQPDRHAKKLVACAWCGIEVLKQSGGGRKYGQTCSNECRGYMQFPYSKLPADHWALWFGKVSAWPKVTWSAPFLDPIACAHCDETFTPRSPQAKYCSKKCTWTWHERNNGVRSEADIYAEARSCAQCSAIYHHTSPGKLYCTNLCSARAANERGAYLHHSWIRPAIRASLYERDNYTCQLCGDPVDMAANHTVDNWAPSLDHIVPRSQGGAHDVDNLRTAHRWCNSVRGDRDPSGMFSGLLVTA